jgi:hypothetical protein
MIRKLRSVVLPGALMTGLLMAGNALAQTAPAATNTTAHQNGLLEISITGDGMMSNTIAGQSFWMEGGNLEVAGQFFHGVSVVADICGTHTADFGSSGVGLDLVTATFGPRYTWRKPKKRYEFFGQALLGEANGFNSVFPAAGGAQDSAYSMAIQAGGGMNLKVSQHLVLRVLEANWLRTQLPNSTTSVQNNVRLGAGIVFRVP